MIRINVVQRPRRRSTARPIRLVLRHLLLHRRLHTLRPMNQPTLTKCVQHIQDRTNALAPVRLFRCFTRPHKSHIHAWRTWLRFWFLFWFENKVYRCNFWWLFGVLFISYINLLASSEIIFWLNFRIFAHFRKRKTQIKMEEYTNDFRKVSSEKVRNP